MRGMGNPGLQGQALGLGPSLQEERSSESATTLHILSGLGLHMYASWRVNAEGSQMKCPHDPQFPGANKVIKKGSELTARCDQ